MSFSDVLRREADRIWQAIFHHPFILELSDGTLPLEKFKFYIRQDYIFLHEFCRALAVSGSKVEDQKELKQFSEFLYNTVNVEVESEEELANMLGMSPSELREAKPSPTNYAYTRHLLASAYADSVGGFMASIMPCVQSYMEIGERLKSSINLRRNPIYERWASTYWGKEYSELVYRRRTMLDALAEKAGEAELDLMRRRYIISSKYEFMFWEMAYNLEEWPI
ncbi:thiaminase II [Candidatus Bathyarchaeota archaeon]|nr:thiaminase II [Candidatus Bathyarchaeota archaeon]